MTRNLRPPIPVIEKLLLVTIVRFNSEIISDYDVIKVFRPDIGHYYQVHFSIKPDVDFNLYETNYKILKIYSETYGKLSRYLGIERKTIKIHLTHRFFNIRNLNNSLILKTIRLQ